MLRYSGIMCFFFLKPSFVLKRKQSIFFFFFFKLVSNMCQFIWERKSFQVCQYLNLMSFVQVFLIILLVELVYCNSVGGDRRASVKH